MMLTIKMFNDTLNPHTAKYLVFIDEFEIGLHPNWQKNIIKYIFDFFKNFHIKINFLIITHSPFLLSDIPKQNIIFLEKDKTTGNCKVVDGLKDKKQTFGANIHTLLSDGFFMNDGLMGEFAKGKINEIREFYKKVKVKDKEKTKKEKSDFTSLKSEYEQQENKFWQIQKIIGEPYLQTIVKNQLEEIELILLGKSKAIDNEIARLQALKESL